MDEYAADESLDNQPYTQSTQIRPQQQPQSRWKRLQDIHRPVANPSHNSVLCEICDDDDDDDDEYDDNDDNEVSEAKEDISHASVLPHSHAQQHNPHASFSSSIIALEHAIQRLAARLADQQQQENNEEETWSPTPLPAASHTVDHQKQHNSGSHRQHSHIRPRKEHSSRLPQTRRQASVHAAASSPNTWSSTSSSSSSNASSPVLTAESVDSRSSSNEERLQYHDDAKQPQPQHHHHHHPRHKSKEAWKSNSHQSKQLIASQQQLLNEMMEMLQITQQQPTTDSSITNSEITTNVKLRPASATQPTLTSKQQEAAHPHHRPIHPFGTAEKQPAVPKPLLPSRRKATGDLSPLTVSRYLSALHERHEYWKQQVRPTRTTRLRSEWTKQQKIQTTTQQQQNNIQMFSTPPLLHPLSARSPSPVIRMHLPAEQPLASYEQQWLRRQEAEQQRAKPVELLTQQRARSRVRVAVHSPTSPSTSLFTDDYLRELGYHIDDPDEATED